MNIVFVDSNELVDTARQLFREYAAILPFDLCFQNFETELAELPGAYAPPEGRLLLTRHGNEAAGCVAFRRLADGICELKRLYLRPGFRGLGGGRLLVSTAIQEAKQAGYERMRLDTHTSLKEAIFLYQSLGFDFIEPYASVPVADVVFMELRLG